ncbi:MAG: hypothetical protein DME42_02935 [Verrucomicrobia bacterium]|nr:MAG: hypothetical protein DME42_02935 [Verrucomicrobiota bacterium]
MNRLAQSVSGIETGTSKCEQCGATTRLGDGMCLSCFLKEGLQPEQQASAAAFESLLAEADVPDKQWRLGNYEILEEIGRGGMGVIYRARQRHSRRIVALKRVLTYQADSHETLARFRREAETAATLDHPNILPIYEVSESEDGLPYFSMKLAIGGSLRTATPALCHNPRQCVQLMAKVACAIEYAHSRKILHRDLQPGNVLLDAHGEPLVSDFGLAKWLDEQTDLTRTLTTFGTPGYIAPEQAEGLSFSPAADIYSLGAILFNLLAGRPPFVGANALSVIRQASVTPAPKLREIAPSLGRDLETIIARCLERDPKARYRSAAALAQDLERWLEGRHILARRVLPPARIWRWSRRNPILAGAAAACLILTSAVVWLAREQFAKAPELPLPEKSIAVLPFENFSDNKENSYFAVGIQDDVLTSLAQIRELKVISRTSVMAYQKPSRRNMREISRALGVANVLEGSVRRTGNRVLLNVQLIDARNDRHIWAQRYDRAVADSIGLQGELATQIAAALKAKLAPEEKARLDARPTTNSEAYVLYLTALGTEDEIAAEQLLMQATAIDPGFALAYARASILNSKISGSTRGDHRAPRAKARAQAEEAVRLSPTLGEAHMALGLCVYWGDKKYDAALKEFEVAAATSPNNAEIYIYVGGIYRRQGRWRESVASFERAISLDPRNCAVAFNAANNHLFMRDWPAAAADYNRALEIPPDFVSPKIGLAYLEVFRNGNPAAGRKILENIPAGNDRDGLLAVARWDLAMLERDYAAAEKVLTDSPLEDFPKVGDAPKKYYQGRVALACGDVESAQRYFVAARPALERWVRDEPDDPDHHARLGLLYAYMQRKEDAIREARRAIELEPESENAFQGAQVAANLALVFALVGEPDQAITLIERLLSTPGAASYPDWPNSITLADLRLRWEWDSLRSNPRFQKILAGPEPKTILTTIQRAAPAAPEKSIAVLPFENLSDDKQNAYFATGVQDEVLANLARIADLKVISRTSVMQYKDPAKRNLREIGQQLGATNVVEGSVQRIANRIRVNAQLINARTDAHIWAQTYDGDLTDVFAIQSQIARAIAEQLQAKISADEKAAIASPPTTDVAANALYQEALQLEHQPPEDQTLRHAIELLEQAVARDPKFALAYSLMSQKHMSLYFGGYDHNATQREQANVALQKATQLQPGAGEVHLAAAEYWFHGFFDYDRARAEIELALRSLPNDPKVYAMTAAMDRRQGRWSEAVRNFERAAELNPRDLDAVMNTAFTYEGLHRYSDATRMYERAAALSPSDYFPRIAARSNQALNERADLRPLRTELNAILAENPKARADILEYLWDCATLERDHSAIERVLALIPSEGLSSGGNFVRPREWYVGYAAYIFDDKQAMRAAFAKARTTLAKQVKEQPDYAACELLPLSKDAWYGPLQQRALAVIYGWTGEKESALAQLEQLATQLPGTDYGDLKLDPNWDPLRGDP